MVLDRNEINVYQYGNTVRFECTFFDFDGNKIDPQIVKFVLYDYRYNEIFSGGGMKNNSNIGEYFYDFTTESKEQKLYYEWYGEIDGKPSLKRGQFMTRFI